MFEPTIAERIYAYYEEHQEDGFRHHLGASLIGDECMRKLWYTFRWVQKAHFDGRTLLIFERGKLEEARFVQHLRNIGCVVAEVNGNGDQHSVEALGGHFGGSMDALVDNVPEAPKTTHVAEFKTHSAKSFKDMVEKGVQKSKPLHYAQMQVYMYLGSKDRALYLAVNKDNDELYAERVKKDSAEGKRLVEKAKDVICCDEPPPRINDNPAWYLCKFCSYHALCHYGTAVPHPNCRTCCHSTPLVHNADGGEWKCERWQTTIPKDHLKDGCESHVFIPQLLAPWEAVDEDNGKVKYKTEHGEFWQGPGGGVSSQWLYVQGKNFPEFVNQLLEAFHGAVEG